MNAMDLMTGLNNVRDKFVVSAGEFRQGQREVRALPKRKLWLIAAVIALALLLVGCAVVYVLRLQDMAFGQETQEAFEGDIRNRTLLSLQGVKGTPGYQATKEWYEWLQTYDTDMSIYHSEEAFSEDFGDDYYAYNLYTREMKDKLDEICAKYHLNLLGKMYVDPDEAAACKALGIQGILRPGVQAETNFGGMRYYADGSFTVEGRMTLTGQNSVWPYEEIVTFSCARKDSFSEIYASIGPEGSYEEWTYTTSDGVDMLIVLEQRNNLNHHAFMVADRGDYVLTFSALEYDHDWTKAALEAFAEAIDFTVQPQRVTEESLAEAEVRREDADKQQADDYDKHIRAYVDQGYEARIKSRMEFSTHPAQLGFCVMETAWTSCLWAKMGISSRPITSGTAALNTLCRRPLPIRPWSMNPAALFPESAAELVSALPICISVRTTFWPMFMPAPTARWLIILRRLKMEPMSGIRASFTIPVKVNISEGIHG